MLVASMTTWFRALVVLSLLASFLLVQAELPVARAVAERAAATGERCAPHRCCCSPEARRAGKCCCASRKARAGYGFHAAGCAESQPEGDATVVVKFQVVLPLVAASFNEQFTLESIFSSSLDAAVQSTEPPDPPPRRSA